jgi:chromosome segregation ATPase
MKFDKIPHQLILILITFVVSFILGLIFFQENLQVFYGIIISLISMGMTTWGTNFYRRSQNMLIYDELAEELDYLEAQEAEIYQSIHSANIVRQEMENRLQNLDKEKAYLLEYIGKLNLERRKLADDVHSLQIKEKYHRDIYATKYKEITHLDSQQDQLSFKLELLETTIEKKQQQLDEIDTYLKEFGESQQTLLQQKNKLIQQVQEIQDYYQELSQNVTKIQQNREQLERQFINEKREIEGFKELITQQNQQQQKYNQILRTLEQRKEELELNIKNLEKENQKLSQVIEEKNNEINNFKKPHVRFDFFPKEWQEWIDFTEQLTPQEKEVFKAILKEDAQTIKTICDQNTTMPQVLIENLNQKALQLMGDSPFINNENSLIPRIHDEYLSIFQELLVIKFLDTLS